MKSKRKKELAQELYQQRKNLNYYKVTVYYVIMPSVILWIIMMVLGMLGYTEASRLVMYLWLVTVVVYFVSFIAQPEKLFGKKPKKN